MSRKVFVLYDGRAKYGPTDDASVYLTAQSEREARENSEEFEEFDDGIWAEYDLNEKDEAVNERLRWDLPPAARQV